MDNIIVTLDVVLDATDSPFAALDEGKDVIMKTIIDFGRGLDFFLKGRITTKEVTAPTNKGASLRLVYSLPNAVQSGAISNLIIGFFKESEKTTGVKATTHFDIVSL